MGWRRHRGFASFVELHVCVLLAVAADAAVALGVLERAGITERSPLKLTFTQLDGAAAHSQNETLAVVIQAVGTGTQCVVNVGVRHAGGDAVFSEGRCGGVSDLCVLVGCQGYGRGRLFFEGVHTVVTVGWILIQINTFHQPFNYLRNICKEKNYMTKYFASTYSLMEAYFNQVIATCFNCIFFTIQILFPQFWEEFWNVRYTFAI